MATSRTRSSCSASRASRTRASGPPAPRPTGWSDRRRHDGLQERARRDRWRLRERGRAAPRQGRQGRGQAGHPHRGQRAGQTGAGMMDCKNALAETDGDFENAVELLRVKGVKDAGKRATRTAANGLVTAELAGNEAGVLVELNCETDFVAKTGLFEQVAGEIAIVALEAGVFDRLAVLAVEARPGVTVQQLIEEAGSSLKEKLELGRFARLEGGYVDRYLHRTDAALPPTIGVLVQLDKENAEVAKDVAQQVAAARPLYLAREDVPPEVVEKERRIAEQITRDEG